MISPVQRAQNLNNLIKAFKDKKLALPKSVKIVEVGPRDGLQNEKKILTHQEKIQLINNLSKTGLSVIETTSFVSKKWVPQMGDAVEVFQGIQKYPNISYPVLVPNLQGLQAAISVGVKEIAVFGAASETFSQKNINCSIDESLKRFQSVVELAQKQQIKIRGYVSCVMGCPYEGDIDPKTVALVTKKLFDLGCYEVSLGDTIGVGTPAKTYSLLDALKEFPKGQLACHFHDTFDKAIPNILVALEQGFQIFDSSIGGLGGCPYAKKSTGNVCTENIVYTFQQLGIETGIDLDRLKQVGNEITALLNRQNECLI